LIRPAVLILLICGSSLSIAAPEGAAEREFLLVGATAGAGTSGVRLGPDLSYLWGWCRDSCGGQGITAG